MYKQLQLLRFNPKRIVSLSPLTTVTQNKPIIEEFKTEETSPGKHGQNHSSRFYVISPEMKKQMFTYGGLPKSFEKQVKTFGETAIMVRNPALEIIHYIKSMDISKKPATRFVLYGKDGVGKSLSLAHVMHYGAENDFILVHVFWVPDWFKKPKEVSNSVTKEGHVDLPLDAAAWLIHFKSQNSKLLSKLNLTLKKDYVWSKRESTPKGAPIMELIEHGISRVKYASEVISVLVEELKVHSSEGNCKVMVAIDGFNAFFHQQTRIKNDLKVKMTPSTITITHPFLSITDYNWQNGVCVLVVDRIAMTTEKMENEFPRYLLGVEGFEHLDPFVPIRVDDYTEKEFTSCIDYYVNRRWIQNQNPGFEKELKFLSGQNPYNLMKICAPL